MKSFVKFRDSNSALNIMVIKSKMVWAGNVTRTDEKRNHAKFWEVNLDRAKFEDLGIYGNIREITRGCAIHSSMRFRIWRSTRSELLWTWTMNLLQVTHKFALHILSFASDLMHRVLAVSAKSSCTLVIVFFCTCLKTPSFTTSYHKLLKFGA